MIKKKYYRHTCNAHHVHMNARVLENLLHQTRCMWHKQIVLNKDWRYAHNLNQSYRCTSRGLVSTMRMYFHILLLLLLFLPQLTSHFSFYMFRYDDIKFQHSVLIHINTHKFCCESLPWHKCVAYNKKNEYIENFTANIKFSKSYISKNFIRRILTHFEWLRILPRGEKTH